MQEFFPWERIADTYICMYGRKIWENPAFCYSQKRWYVSLEEEEGQTAGHIWMWSPHEHGDIMADPVCSMHDEPELRLPCFICSWSYAESVSRMVIQPPLLPANLTHTYWRGKCTDTLFFERLVPLLGSRVRICTDPYNIRRSSNKHCAHGISSITVVAFGHRQPIICRVWIMK
jgi:hypothetical protein